MQNHSSWSVLITLMERFADLVSGDTDAARLAVRGLLVLALVMLCVLLYRMTVILFGEFDNGSTAMLLVLSDLWLVQMLA